MSHATINANTATEYATKYAEVNGVNMYYEVHGTGMPLVLIHGGFGVAGMFAQLIPALAATCQVIAVELQGHGHTADIDRPFSLTAMADDVAALIQHLGFAQADIFGYSLGGVVALQCAIRHSNVVRKLIFLSAPYKTEGWYPGERAAMHAMDAEAMVGTIMHQAYMSIAPQPQDWPVLVGKTRHLLVEQPFDFTAEVAALQVPTLIVAGDADNIPPSHAVEMFELLGGGQQPSWPGQEDGAQRTPSQLAILPGADHYSIFMRVDLLMPVVLPFLNT